MVEKGKKYWLPVLPSFPINFQRIFASHLCRKVVGGFGKKSCVEYLCEKARKHICVTDCHDMTLAVKVALNPNTTNQPTH